MIITRLRSCFTINASLVSDYKQLVSALPDSLVHHCTYALDQLFIKINRQFNEHLKSLDHCTADENCPTVLTDRRK